MTCLYSTSHTAQHTDKNDIEGRRMVTRERAWPLLYLKSVAGGPNYSWMGQYKS